MAHSNRLFKGNNRWDGFWKMLNGWRDMAERVPPGRNFADFWPNFQFIKTQPKIHVSGWNFFWFWSIPDALEYCIRRFSFPSLFWCQIFTNQHRDFLRSRFPSQNFRPCILQPSSFESSQNELSKSGLRLEIGGGPLEKILIEVFNVKFHYKR